MENRNAPGLRPDEVEAAHWAAWHRKRGTREAFVTVLTGRLIEARREIARLTARDGPRAYGDTTGTYAQPPDVCPPQADRCEISGALKCDCPGCQFEFEANWAPLPPGCGVG